MAFQRSICLLFLLLRASLGRDAFLLLGTLQDGTVNQSSSDVLDLTVPVVNANQLPAVRLTVLTNTSNLLPLLVSVQQSLGVSSFELPQTRSGYNFQHYSQIMCPFLNTPRNDTEGNATITMTVTVSTSASINVNYTLFAEEINNFYLQLGDEVDVLVNPGGPAVFYYEYPPGDPLQQVLFHLTDYSPSRNVCALVHIQDSLCPLEIVSGTLNLQGEYQTMLGQGAILEQRPPSGRVYLGITIVPDDFFSNASTCSTALSADLLASFVTIERKGDNNAAGPSITDEAFSRKNITLRVRLGRSVAQYAYAMAVLAGVFLLFYLLALLVISRFAKPLIVALCTGQLCGNNVDSKDDGVEHAEAIDAGDPVSLCMSNTYAEFGEEETDGWSGGGKPLASNGSEAIEMKEIRRPSDPEDGVKNVTRSLPRNVGVSFSVSTPERPRKAQTIARDTRHQRAPFRRQRTSVSESSPMGSDKCKPTVLDILSGRYEDYRLRTDSGSRRGTGSSFGGEDRRRLDSVSSVGQRNRLERASTISSCYGPDPGSTEQPERPKFKKAYSVKSPTDTQRPFVDTEREGVQHASNPSLASRHDTEPRSHPMSLQLHHRANSFTSGSTTPSPLEPPPTPIRAGTPLDSIKEEDTLPRKPKRPPLSRIQSVDEEAGESLLASHSSESSHGSESGTPVQVRRQSPSSVVRNLVSPGAKYSVQKAASLQKENELLTPLVRDDATVQGSVPLATQENRQEPAAPSVGTPNAITDPTQREPQISDQAVPHGVQSALSPLANGQGEEENEEERSTSAQPLAESREFESRTSTHTPGEMEGELGEQESTAIELRHDDCNGDFLMDPNLAEMTFPEGKDAQRQSNRFVWQLIGVSLFYLLPAFQLVIAYQKFLDISGNQDLCFYNHLCSWPISIMRSVNNIWSNCGYIALGFLLFFVVHRAKYNYRRHESNVNEPKGDNRREKEGVPQYFGIYFALSFVLIAQGFTSAAYHICPNQATFQFDTAFMYIMAGLACLRIFQSRHPDRTPSASFAFIGFAVILIIAVVGTLHADRAFYIVWFFVYQFIVVFLVLEYYYRWRLTSLRAIKIKLCRKPSKPGNVPKFVFGVLCLCLNLGIGIAGVLVMADFGSHMLVVFISNFGFYMIYYIIVKMTLREWPPYLMVVYFVIAFVFWIPAIYFFIQPVTDWSKTASESREGNRDCILFFYDEHDLWHVLSAFALFFSMLAIMNFDSRQRHWRRDQLKVF